MMNNKRMILLVEDDDLDADLASRAFQRAEVTNALVRVRDGDGGARLPFARGKYAARDVHDLPVLDLDIPKISGLKVLEAIRADESITHLPVIILTSFGEERDRLGTYNHFAKSDVIKPLDYDQLWMHRCSLAFTGQS
jgi:DNA-binding response OmpR family regulator